MIVLIFAPIFLLNILLMLFIIRWRGVCSFAGLGMLFLLVVVISDFIGLSIGCFMEPDVTGEILKSRIYPTLIHIIGLIALVTGLFIINPKPRPIPRQFNEEQKKTIIKTACFFVVLGLSMKFLALCGAGIINLQSYFQDISGYVVSQRQFGGFLDKGLTIALIGLGLIAVTQKSFKRQGIILLIMMILTFSLSYSRGGIIGALIIFFFLLLVFNRKRLKIWLNPALVVFFIFLIILTAGIKSQIRTGLQDLDTSLSERLRWGIARFQDRFSSGGLYDGYSNFINRIYIDESQLRQGDVFKYTATAWVPYLIYKDKPQHPFRAIGDLVYRDFNVNIEDVSAVMLVGTAFFDYGLYSVFFYLLLYGMLIGGLRRLTTSGNGSPLLFIWYLYFIFGASNFIHGGIVNISDSIALTTGVIILAFFYLKALSIIPTIIKTAAKPVKTSSSSNRIYD